MTEVPEHLLRRSRERRSASGGGGGDEGGAAPAGGAAPSSSAPAKASAAPAKAAAAPAAAAPPPPPPPPPPYVVAAQTRPKVPYWAMPVLALLPVWAFIYAGSLSQPGEELEPVLAAGEAIYRAQCAGCHGAAGQGASGRPIDEVELTFPDPMDHIAWVRDGSPAAGTPYGDPDRPGGQHVSQEDNWVAMPGFAEGARIPGPAVLTDEEIIAVVRYEREVLGGEEESPLPLGEDGYYALDPDAEPAGADQQDGPTSQVAEAEAAGGDTDGGAGANVDGESETQSGDDGSSGQGGS